MSLFAYDHALLLPCWCGIDEAGRGPLAGPVYAACVVFMPETPVIEGLNDSKKISAKKRDALYDEIIEKAADYAVASASVEEIEQLNILWAAMLAMRRAYEGLAQKPQTALIDGDRAPDLGDTRCITVVKGDSTSAAIAAASILAKVSRDRDCLALHEQYPQYEFDRHKGYGTKLHYEKLREFGPCPAHRPSFLKKWKAT